MERGEKCSQSDERAREDGESVNFSLSDGNARMARLREDRFISGKRERRRRIRAEKRFERKEGALALSLFVPNRFFYPRD